VRPSAAMLSTPQLAEEFKGRVIGPDDPDYDAARTVFPGNIDHRPALIVRVADAADVARAIVLARETGQPLGVRSGGHSAAGHGVPEGGIVIDLSDMKALEIDVEGRIAWAESGLTAGEYTVATGEHGLATGFGDTASVGIGGITLGGGQGFLSRKYGLTIDDLLAAEVVTADAEVLQVDSESHPDLFWAIRGGGGNFGVVTRFKYRLHEVGTIVGGMLFLPATPDVIAGFVAAAEAAPDELSAIANVMPAPPMPFVPAEYHGKPVVMALMAYAGSVDGADEVLAPFRALATPIADMLRPITYPEIYPPEEEDFHPVAFIRTMFVDSIDRDRAELILKRIGESTAMMSVTQIRVLGGAIARVPNDATAFAHRDSRIMLNVAAMVAAPGDVPGVEPWVNGLAGELLQSDAGAYVGFLADEGEQRVRAAYPGATWDRLVEVKRRYDPDNIFASNQNITPG
jgi:FAD/FMN-containing dehydrogenase